MVYFMLECVWKKNPDFTNDPMEGAENTVNTDEEQLIFLLFLLCSAMVVKQYFACFVS